MIQMYDGVVNSIETVTTGAINATDTIINILDETRIPEAPNLLVLGSGASAETVKLVGKNGSVLTVERGLQGTAKSWASGTLVARNFTEYDHRAFKENIETLNTNQQTTNTQLAQHTQENANKAHGGFKGALVKRTTNISISNITYTPVPFQEVVYDNSGFFNATSPTRLTIPSDVTKVRLKGFAHWSPNNTGVRIAVLSKNGNIIEPRDARLAQDESSQSFTSPTLNVAAGDYFEIRVFHARGSSLDLRFETYFAIEVVE